MKRQKGIIQKEHHSKRVSYKRLIGIVLILITLGLTLYCMVNHLGLIDGLDFGAGAYYYADIPEFAKYVDGNHYVSETPAWLLIALFLLWGLLMYKLWTWLEKKIY